jgi:hypothetical protein
MSRHHFESTAIHLVLASRPMKIMAAHLSPTRPLIDTDLTECLSWGMSVLMAGNLNAKHTDWNFRGFKARGALLRDYADRNACLMYGPDSPATFLYQVNTDPDILDIVVYKGFVSTVYLTVCPALSSGHLPVLIDTACRTYFTTSSTAPISSGMPGLHRRQTPGGIPWYTTRGQLTSALRTCPAPLENP